MGRRQSPDDRPSVLDDSNDRTVADEPYDFSEDVEYETPVTQRRCAQCGSIALLGGRDDFAGGLPGICAVSEDARWRYCATLREVTYKLRDGDPAAWRRR